MIANNRVNDLGLCVYSSPKVDNFQYFLTTKDLPRGNTLRTQLSPTI